MINITNKQNCCGCSACAQRCPKQCISMQADSEGFLYPKVDMGVCIDCHLCEKVCPVINPNEPRTPLGVYAAKNANDEVRMASSSGGIFTCLAQRVLADGGVVFGARWDDDWNVVHDYTEQQDGLPQFCSSKYLQSVIGDNYQKAEQFLKAGRKVMFTGTPCQIAGLRQFLRKDYDNLLAVEVICHSVPSAGVWQQYLHEKLRALGWKKSDIHRITFRNKATGWKSYSFLIENYTGDAFMELGSANTFMRGFLADLYTRPSCTACPAKQLKSGSDITLGDFWGIGTLKPELDDDKGLSVIVVNTAKGKDAIYNIGVKLHSVAYEALTQRNPALITPVAMQPKRTAFFCKDGQTVEQKVKRLAKEPFSLRVFISRILHRCIPNALIEKLKTLK